MVYRHCRGCGLPASVRWSPACKNPGPTGRRKESPKHHSVSGVTDREHRTSHDIERYAGLFARRTRQMRSSAMRDLMAITARPDVISLAGGLPDTSTFPPDTFAALMARIARESCAAALQYGPTEGFEQTKVRIAEVMAAEGMRVDTEDIVVTTGG